LSTVPIVAGATLMEPRTVRIRMRDGVHLATDVYLPRQANGRRAPVVFARGPYGKRELVACQPAIASVLVEHGYAVIAQDIRGRYGSEGVAAPFSPLESGDAWDTLEWMATQRWAADAAIMIGDSYGGWLQWAAVAAGHRLLRGIVPGMTSTRIGDDWMYDHGTFCLSTMAEWAVTAWSGGENAFRDLDWTGRPLGDLVDSWVRGSDAEMHLERWTTHAPSDPFWRTGAFGEVRADRVEVPALHLGGWWDLFRSGQLDDWRAARHRPDQYLVMSCTDHHHVPLQAEPWLGTADEDDLLFAERYVATILPFLELVSGRATAPPQPVRYEVAYAGWREADRWPPAELTRLSLHLVDGARALVDAHGGGLSERPARVPMSVSWTHDPEHLVPSLAPDPFAMLVKPPDERLVQERDDVLTFSTPPLERPLELVGSSVLHLPGAVEHGRQFVVKLSDVFLDGRAFGITEGARTIRGDGRTDAVTVPLRACSYRLRPGHSLRLEIAASHFPRYLPGAPSNPWLSLGEPTTYRLEVGGLNGSRLDLSVMPCR
jgi:putative CocE/NonD family hydrolase